jgi:hypothetical protein
MSDPQTDPLNGELPTDADLDAEKTGRENVDPENEDAADDVAAAAPGDASGLRVDGEAPLP